MKRIHLLTATTMLGLACGMLGLAPTAASAATTTAPAPHHVTVPRAADASGCVTETFDISDEGTYEPCVADEQILLNDLWRYGDPGPDQLLTVDGYYGPDTTNDVISFQETWGIGVDGITGPQTWATLCEVDQAYGFTGTYWHDAGCATE
jgi:peptidoglycan hydrolase-like protein with peptidoglycan-binding domain